MVYLLGWALIYGVVAVQLATRYRGLALILGILPYFAALAFLRGDVGTDTFTYELMFREFDGRNYEWNGIEPGFIALAATLMAIIPDADLAVRACALVFFSLLALVIIRGDENERFFCIAYFLPITAYSYSMNVLRVGFAALILVLATQEIRKGSLKRLFLAGLPSVLFHYTSLFGLSYLMISQRPWLKFSSVVSMLLLLLLSIAVFFVAEVYLLGKIGDYAPQAGERYSTILTSIFVVCRVSLVFVVLLFTKLPAAEKFRLIVLVELFLVTAGLLSQYSYAGLRVFALISFLGPLSILASYSRLGLNFEGKLKIAFIASSLIGAAGTYYGFLNAAGRQITPFLPYETWLP